jgi:hypothetical protein
MRERERKKKEEEEEEEEEEESRFILQPFLCFATKPRLFIWQ